MRVIWESWQKARTRHFCDKCAFPIQNETYKRTVFAESRSMLFVFKEHDECPEDDDEWVQRNKAPLRETESIALVVELQTVEEQVVTIDGSTVTRPRIVSTLRTVPADEADTGGDDEVPF